MAFGTGVWSTVLCVFLLLDYCDGRSEYRFPAGSREAQSLRHHAMCRQHHRFTAVDLQHSFESPGFGRSDETVWPACAGSETLPDDRAHAFPAGRGRAVTGIFFHEYHYDWLWLPMRLALVLIMAVSILTARVRWRPVATRISWAALILYFAGGVYLAAICVTR